MAASALWLWGLRVCAAVRTRGPRCCLDAMACMPALSLCTPTRPQGIAHGIPEVLIPPGYDLAAARAAQLTAGAPRAAQQPGAAGHHHRRRLAFNEPALVTMKLNAAETAIRDRVRSQFREDEDRWR